MSNSVRDVMFLNCSFKYNKLYYFNYGTVTQQVLTTEQGIDGGGVVLFSFQMFAVP